MKMSSSFTHPDVVPSLFKLIYNVGHKRRYFDEPNPPLKNKYDDNMFIFRWSIPLISSLLLYNLKLPGGVEWMEKLMWRHCDKWLAYATYSLKNVSSGNLKSAA